jgi:hypothetical protein
MHLYNISALIVYFINFTMCCHGHLFFWVLLFFDICTGFVVSLFSLDLVH